MFLHFQTISDGDNEWWATKDRKTVRVRERTVKTVSECWCEHFAAQHHTAPHVLAPVHFNLQGAGGYGRGGAGCESGGERERE
jgi:hypothetical protein